MKLNITLLLALASLITACSTGYYPLRAGLKKLPEGYQDIRLPDGSFEISYSTTPPTNLEEALALWHRRAKELCKGKEYVSETAVDLRPSRYYEASTYRYQTNYWPLVTGKATCS